MIPDQSLLEIVASMIVIPWVVFITVSIFNQRQEIALMKQSHTDLKNMLETLVKVFKNSKFSRD